MKNKEKISVEKTFEQQNHKKNKNKKGKHNFKNIDDGIFKGINTN